jgi:Uma2 family endonuclease
MAGAEALPPTCRREIIDGELYAFPRPDAAHSEIESAVAEELRPPFYRGFGGPGGWWILVEPALTLPGLHELSPDLGAWRKEHLARLPRRGHIDVVPDWVCEIHSSATRVYDLSVKRAFYARIGVKHCWYIDLEKRLLTVSRLEGRSWVEVGVFGADEAVLIEPFDAIEIDLPEWWSGIPAEQEAEEETTRGSKAMRSGLTSP